MTCVHHWMIPPPTSKETVGVCSLCNERKGMSNLPGDMREIKVSPALVGKARWEVRAIRSEPDLSTTNFD